MCLTPSGKVCVFSGTDTIHTVLHEVGYPYVVSFKICPDKNTNISGILFEGPHSKVYTNWENTGRIAFSRDGYTLFSIHIVSQKKNGQTFALQGTIKELRYMLMVNCKNV